MHYIMLINDVSTPDRCTSSFNPVFRDMWPEGLWVVGRGTDYRSTGSQSDNAYVIKRLEAFENFLFGIFSMR